MLLFADIGAEDIDELKSKINWMESEIMQINETLNTLMYLNNLMYDIGN